MPIAHVCSGGRALEPLWQPAYDPGVLGLMFWICLVAGLVFLTVVGDFSLWITGGVLAFVAVTWAAG